MSSNEEKVSPLYVFSAVVLPLVIPAIFIAYHPSWDAAIKWFAFWAIGLRLGLAGVRQIFNPQFTAGIFGIADAKALPLVREVGMGNLSFATLALASMAVPAWRLPALLAGGIYFGLAAAGHLGHKPGSKNEAIALVTDILVFLALASAFVAGLLK